MLWKLDGLSEYDVRRPLTSTGTNLLGLIKHLATSEARALGWRGRVRRGDTAQHRRDTIFWKNHWQKVEHSARAADPHHA